MFVIRRNVSFSRARRVISSDSLWPQQACTATNRLRWARPFSSGLPCSAKRVSKKQVKELVQGTIKGEPLPPADKDDLRQMSLLDVVRSNMIKFPNCVVLTKVGNFYELYFEHADEYAPKLGLRVASKGKDGVSMAGFQYTQLDKYLKKLVQELDKHVAICEEFPEYVKGKLQTPIPRRVTRVVTPGTLLDEDFVEQDRNNFLLSIHEKEEAATSLNENSVSESPNKSSASFGMAWIDISTGEFFVQTVDRTSLSSALMRIGASEVVLSDNITARTREEIALSLGLNVERLASLPRITSNLDFERWITRLDQPMPSTDRSKLSSQEMAACQGLFDYIDRHLIEFKIKPQPPQQKEQVDTMAIDRSSIRGLELLKTSRDGLGKGSLFNTIQRTVTKGGSRLLRERLVYPSISCAEIEQRLDLVSTFIAAQDLYHSIIIHLRQIYDVVRIAQKLALNRGDADELLCLANTCLKMNDVMKMLEPYAETSTPQGRSLRALISRFVSEGPAGMCVQIKRSIDEQGISNWLTRGQDLALQESGESIDDSIPTTNGDSSKQGNGKGDNDFLLVMQRSASPELENLHVQLDGLHQNKYNLQQRLREQLAAPKLALRYDTKYGHVCQTPRAKGITEEVLSQLGASLVGNLKTIKTFYLSEWTSLGRQIETIKFDIRQEEQKIFETLRQLVVENLVPLRQNAGVLHELDLATSFATLAMEENWTRPVITNKTTHTIVGGRHPTVKLGLQEKGRSFVSNDLTLDRRTRSWLITGPNMAGKSTFLRQNALITILAQVGCYVPAEYAEIGIVDKIFSRIGAADDLFRNESTFMVEMLETACILRDATDRSFVIMDEVGRGTAPEDGTAVAFASLHHLYHNNKCRTLFATHFHELADRTADWPQLAQYCSDLFEDDAGSFTFIHKLRPGVNRKSHALRVAKMAGLPQDALDVAQDMLDQAH